MSKEKEILREQVEYDNTRVINETDILNVYLVYGCRKEDSLLLHLNYQSEDYIKSLKIINMKTGVIGSPAMRSVFNRKYNATINSYFLTIQSTEHLILSITDLRLLIDINYRLHNSYLSRTTNLLDKYKEALKKAIKANLMKLVNKFKTASANMEDYSVVYAMEAPNIVDYIYDSSLKMDRFTLTQMLNNQNLLFKELI